MRENAILFGTTKSLVGVVTDPPTPGDDSPLGIILLNAGMVHRVGPNRCYVKIARRLAAAGFVTLRFDFSAIGDSGVRTDGLPFEKSAIRETREAMDFLTATWGIRRFALLGLCSGADYAFSAACHDPRVIGLVLIDGFTAAFPAMGFYARLYARNFFRRSSWRRLLTGRSLIWGALRKVLGSDVAAPGVAADLDGRLSSVEATLDGLRLLIERGVALLLAYSADTPAYDNYLSRLRPVIRRSSREPDVRVQRFGGSDHEFGLLSAQEELVKLIVDWAQGAGKGLQGEPRARGREAG